MTERTDHASWAREYIRAAQNAFDDDVTSEPREEPTVAENIALAQVHATLALVEHQRLANLIAIYNANAEAEIGYASEGFDFTLIADRIREGLGL